MNENNSCTYNYVHTTPPSSTITNNLPCLLICGKSTHVLHCSETVYCAVLYFIILMQLLFVEPSYRAQPQLLSKLCTVCQICSKWFYVTFIVLLEHSIIQSCYSSETWVSERVVVCEYL